MSSSEHHVFEFFRRHSMPLLRFAASQSNSMPPLQIERSASQYEPQGDEERYKALGVTKAGRVLVGIWTPRRGKVRAVTAYPASRTYRKLYWETAR